LTTQQESFKKIGMTLKAEAALEYHAHSIGFLTGRREKGRTYRQVQAGSGVDKSVIHRFEQGRPVSALNYIALQMYARQHLL
jgi:hypothetical protein